MKFLVDAQLPARLARVLQDAGHQAVHTASFQRSIARPTPGSLSSPIVTIAWSSPRTATSATDISLSADLDDSWWSRPDISNRVLLDLVEQHLRAIEAAFDEADYVELGSEALRIHPRPD